MTTARESRIPQYGCLRCGIDVWEYRALCRDCRAVTITMKEEDRWIEPRTQRRAFMARVNDYGRIPVSARRAKPPSLR